MNDDNDRTAADHGEPSGPQEGDFDGDITNDVEFEPYEHPTPPPLESVWKEESRTENPKPAFGKTEEQMAEERSINERRREREATAN